MEKYVIKITFAHLFIYKKRLFEADELSGMTEGFYPTIPQRVHTQ